MCNWQRKSLQRTDKERAERENLLTGLFPYNLYKHILIFHFLSLRSVKPRAAGKSHSSSVIKLLLCPPCLLATTADSILPCFICCLEKEELNRNNGAWWEKTQSRAQIAHSKRSFPYLKSPACLKAQIPTCFISMYVLAMRSVHDKAEGQGSVAGCGSQHKGNSAKAPSLLKQTYSIWCFCNIPLLIIKLIVIPNKYSFMPSADLCNIRNKLITKIYLFTNTF